MSETHHVVIVGGGFGGLQAAQTLKMAPVRGPVEEPPNLTSLRLSVTKIDQYQPR
jgi:thioredoxin reductase